MEKWLTRHKISEDKKLELRLGPPGEFHGYNSITSGAKRAFRGAAESNATDKNWFTDNDNSQFHKLSSPEKTVKAEDSSQPWSLAELQQHSDKKACPSPASALVSSDTAATDNLQRRIVPAQVVGWPPIRSFRKNLAGNGLSKSATDSPNKKSKDENDKNPSTPTNNLFVKVNMEGIPIGRKINVTAYDSYEKLSYAIDELFRGLLAAQSDSSGDGNENNMEESKSDSDSLAGSGEYTLVYEDNEGDRMLVGDVPWHMFVTTVKRLRVLKSSELSILQLDGSGQRRQDTTKISSRT